MMDKAVAEVTSDKDTTSTELNAVLKDAYIEPPEDKDDTGDKSDVPPGSQVWLGQLLAHWTNALTLDSFVKRADAVGEYWCTLDSPQSKSLQTLELGVGELKLVSSTWRFLHQSDQLLVHRTNALIVESAVATVV